MADVVEEIVARLAEIGVDSAQFVRYGVDAAGLVAGGDADRRRAVLERLEAFARVLRANGMESWNAWNFGVAELARAFPGQPDAFLPRIGELERLVEALAKSKLDETALQRLPPSLQAAANRPWIAEAVLVTAREIAAAGADPGDALRVALPAIARAATGVPEPDPYGEPPAPPPPPDRAVEEPRFAPVASAVRESFIELDAHGIPPTWPIAQGVAAIARTFAGDPAAMAERLREMTELCLVLHENGIVPHPTIEHGVVTAFEQVGGEGWLRDEVFPLAFAIASAGKEPLLALSRMGSLYGFGPERGPALANRIRALAELGTDVGRLLSTVYALQGIAGDAEADRFDGLFAASGSLLEAVHAAGMRPAQAFEEGLPYVLRTAPGQLRAESVLALARRLVRASIDPGPVLQHGVLPAFAEVAEAFEDPAVWQPIVDTILTSANAILDANANPWHFLSPGVHSAVRVAGRDATAIRELVEETRDLALDLSRAGIDPEPMLRGLHNLAIDLQGQRAVYSSTLQSLREYAPALKARGIDPAASASRGLAEAAGLARSTGAGWLVPGAAELGRRLADAGVEPSGVLTSGLAALVKAAGSSREALEPLFADVVTTAAALGSRADRRPAVPLEDVVAACALENPDAGAAIRDALRLLRDAAAKGHDASALAAAVVPVIAPSEARDSLFDALTAFVPRAPRGAGSAFAQGAAAAASVAGNDPRAFADGLTVLNGAWTVSGADVADPDPGALFSIATRAAATVAGTRPAVWASLTRALAERTAHWKRENLDVRPALQRGAWTAARAAGDREDAFLDALDAYVRIAAARGGPDDELGQLLAEHVAPLAVLGAAGNAQQMVASLDEVARLRETLARVEGARWILPWVGRFGELVRRVPAVWRSLLAPVLRAPAASNLLDALLRLQSRIEDEEAVALLKHVVTQEGVRAPEILWGLLVQGVGQGTIASLSAERELLLGFLRDVPVVDAGFYERYRANVNDENRSDAEKRLAIEALGSGVAGLAEAIVAGEIPADRENDPLLAHVLFHVFPPAVSVTRERYDALFRQRADHPEHMKILGGERPPIAEMRLPRGGYRLRAGESIDPAFFASLKAAVAAVHAAPGEEDLETLGLALFGAWIDGTIGAAEPRAGFLTRLYRRHHEAGHSLPESPDSAEEMLRYREFLADAAREIVQEAFRAARAADPDRYDAQARAKLSPKPFVGPGLVRTVWRTVDANRAGTLATATARERLARQLKGFDLSGGGNDRVLGCADRAALEALLPQLPVKNADVALGAEHVRALQDLTGSELAAIQRELFGEGETKGKLEYHDDAEKDGLVLELEVTKRRAHVPIGFCEGVCTATDEELWNDERFLQVVIWGEDDGPGGTPGTRRRRARGGMHLLVVKREGTSAALALPGINPSLDLLAEAGAVAILDRLLAFAVDLAKRAGFGAVWIPDHSGILSNRGPVHAALAEKKLPTKSIPATVFSYRPYSYRFDRVLVVWE